MQCFEFEFCGNLAPHFPQEFVCPVQRTPPPPHLIRPFSRFAFGKGSGSTRLALGYTKHTKAQFDWTLYLLASYEVGMKYIHREVSYPIGQFEHTMV